MKPTFAEISKQLRKEKNVSQVQLAKALNVSNGCIAMLETNKSEPTANTLAKYAEFFGCTTDFLLGREPIEESLAFLPSTPIGEQLTPDEKEMLSNYRKLTKANRMHADAYILVRLENQQEERPHRA